MTDSDKTGRPKRTALYKQNSLTAESREGYTRYWMNEESGRFEQFTKAGWTPVVGGEANSSDKSAQTESQLGSVIRKRVNKDPNASSNTAILMEIPTEWYLEDLKEQQKEIDKTEASYNPDGYKPGSTNYGYMRKEIK